MTSLIQFFEPPYHPITFTCHFELPLKLAYSVLHGFVAASRQRRNSYKFCITHLISLQSGSSDQTRSPDFVQDRLSTIASALLAFY